MQALKDRKSSREFSSEELSLQVILDMLWAANGINRPDTNGRTAPSAMNCQEIDVYVAKKDGFVLFVSGTKKDDEVRIRVTRVLQKVGFAEVVGEKAGEEAAGKRKGNK